MRIALYESNRDNKPESVDLTWEELCAALSDFKVTDCAPCPGKGKPATATSPKVSECTEKYCEAWSPVEIEGTRANVNVRAVTVAVFDLDHITRDELAKAAEALEGFSYIAHTTHSHEWAGEDDQCLRVVLELTRPVPANYWRPFLAHVVSALGLPADPTCKDLSRLYFFPSTPKGKNHFAEIGKGEPLDVDSVLAEIKPEGGTRAKTGTAPGSASTPLPASFELPAIIDRIAQQRTAYKRAKDERGELLERVIKGEALAPSGARDNTVNQAASILAVILPSGTPVDVPLAVLHRSIGAMDCEPEGFDHWMDRASYSYRRAMERRIENDAIREVENEKLRARMLGLSKRGTINYTDATREGEGEVAVALGLEDFPEAADEDEEGTPRERTESEEKMDVTDAELAADPDAWARLLRWKAPPPNAPEGSTSIKLFPTVHNARVILTYHAAWRGVIRFNLLTKDLEVHGGPLPESDRNLEVLPIAIAGWFEAVADISLHSAMVEDVISLVARRNAYDPLREYLEGIEWDGTERIDRWLVDYCKAPQADDLGNPLFDYLELVGPKFLMGAVARGLKPGVQVDNVIIFESGQGGKKSSTFRALGGDFFADSAIVLADKDSRMLAATSWIIEIADLASFRKGETETLKAFFTAPTDKFRPPYGHAMEKSPRRAVFCGTINPEGVGYLPDPTGNRRYWPVTVGDVCDLRAIERDRDQLFAEAVVRVREGLRLLAAGAESEEIPTDFRWWLEGDEKKIAERQTEERATISSTSADLIAAWWYALEPAKRPEFTRTSEIAEKALRLLPERITRATETEIGFVMRRMGFEKHRRRILGVPSHVYVPNAALRDAARSSPGRGALSPVQSIAGARATK